MGLTKYVKELVVETGIVSRDTLEVQGDSDLQGDVDVDGGLAVQGGASVDSAPTSSNDVARKNETDAVQDNLDDHENDTSNPHGTTASQVGAPSQSEFDDHSDRHQQGGADELDAADLSGSSGSGGQFLKTDGNAAFWDEVEAGLSPDDFERETGTVDISSSSTSGSVSFDNVYDPRVIVTTCHFFDASSSQAGGMAVDSYNTDGNGDITGFDWRWQGSSGSGSYTVRWRVLGVRA